MKKSICILVGYLLLSLSQAIAQQYTATEYWKMENDAAYTRLLMRQKAGEVLSDQDLNKLMEYKNNLEDYFQKLSDNEKSIYYKNRAKWSAQPGTVDKKSVPQEEDVYAGERSMYTRYLVTSGIFGFFYGVAADYVFGIESSGGMTAVPLLAAGASTLVPILTIKDKNVSYNSLALANHGKAIGALQGAALGLLMTGEVDNDAQGKLVVSVATLSSMAMGRLGYVLGRDKPWTQGRAALYTHYGVLMPLEGLALDVTFQADDPRIYGATSLVFGACGYLIADAVARKNDFTRGDVTAISTVSAMNGLLGLGILADLAENTDVGSASILIPAIGALGGSIAGQMWVKDARLTSQQGRNTALAATGGSLIGLGLTAIFTPENATPYYIMGYAAGMTSFALLVHKYKQENNAHLSEKYIPGRWNVNLMPQNLILNKKIASIANANPGKRVYFLPAFTATLNF